MGESIAENIDIASNRATEKRLFRKFRYLNVRQAPNMRGWGQATDAIVIRAFMTDIVNLGTGKVERGAIFVFPGHGRNVKQGRVSTTDSFSSSLVDWLSGGNLDWNSVENAELIS